MPKLPNQLELLAFSSKPVKGGKKNLLSRAPPTGTKKQRLKRTVPFLLLKKFLRQS